MTEIGREAKYIWLLNINFINLVYEVVNLD